MQADIPPEILNNVAALNFRLGNLEEAKVDTCLTLLCPNLNVGKGVSGCEFSIVSEGLQCQKMLVNVKVCRLRATCARVNTILGPCLWND